jgi:hypothetical protein
MRSVSVIMNRNYKLLTLLFSIFTITATAQENSPYSRYGLGDIVPNTSITNRGMGGIVAGFVDYDKRFDLKEQYPKSQTVNFLNPASYAKMRITSFDLGFEVDSRTLHQPDTTSKFRSVSAIISYVQLGVPLSRKRNFGMNIGLRPVTRINYKIDTRSRDKSASTGALIDSLQTINEGSGGSYQAYIGLGKSFRNLSIGFNTGYFFGTKDYSTRKSYIPDSVDVSYYSSNHQTKTSFGGVFFDFGAQYRAELNKKTVLNIGAYGNLRQKFNAEKEVLDQTFSYDVNGALFNIDTVSFKNNQEGNLDYPSTFGFGFMIDRLDRWQFGADFTSTSWDNYSFFGEKEAVKNSWLIKVGGQFMPDAFDPKNYWSHVTYRFGFNFGPDYIYLNNKLPQFGISAGAGLPVRKNPYSNQFTSINLSFEYGRRGNANSLLRENLFRVGLGFTLSDLWFIKKKYY